MKTDQTFITILHLDDFKGLLNIRVNDTLKLKKDIDNDYDDEAIAIYDKNNLKIGYVANSIDTVNRGTSSAGRIYDQINDNTSCIVQFICKESSIALLK